MPILLFAIHLAFAAPQESARLPMVAACWPASTDRNDGEGAREGGGDDVDPDANEDGENGPRDGDDRLALPATEIRGDRPTLDGCLDEPAWSEATTAKGFVQSEPDWGEEATEATEVRVLVDRAAIYVGARLHDTRPGDIHAPLSHRDDPVFSDWFVVLVDTNLDGRTAAGFAVNPRGVKRDYLVHEGFREDPDWQAVWDAGVRVDSLGWSVEIRIPLSQIGLPPLDEEAGRQFGVNFLRHLGRNAEISSWSPVPRRRADVVAGFGRLGGLDDVRRPLRFEVTPYVMGSLEHRPFSEDVQELHPFGTVGLDAVLGLPGGLSLSTTVNPDFGQVEADPAVVNTSGYRTFFPEKRPFFLEDRDLFEVDVGGAYLFHSRRIGRGPLEPGYTSQGLAGLPDASGILAATKLSGRAHGWGIGLLHVATNVESVLTEDSLGVEYYEPLGPRTHYAVARVEREAPDGTRRTGGIFTLAHRSSLPDLPLLVSQAFVAGLDHRWRPGGGAHEIGMALVGSHVRGSPEIIGSLQTAHGRYLQRPDASHVRYDPGRRSLTGFTAEVEVSRIESNDWIWGLHAHGHSPGFEVNDVGFQRDADVVRQTGYAGYDRTTAGSLLRRRRFILTQWNDWTFGAERVATGASAELRLQLRSLWGIWVVQELNLAGLSTDILRGGPALVMPGSTRTRVTLSSDPRRSVYFRFDGTRSLEGETGATFENLRLQANVQPVPRLNVSLQPQVSWRRESLDYVTNRPGPEQVHYLFGRINQRVFSLVTRADLAFSPNLSLRLYAQPYFTDRRVADLMEATAPRAASLEERFRPLRPDEFHRDPDARRVFVDVTGDGASDFSFPDPDFHFAQWTSNLVLRWEFRPASTLFLVWSREARERRPGLLDSPLDGLADLFWMGGQPIPGKDALVVKLSYRLGT